MTLPTVVLDGRRIQFTVHSEPNGEDSAALGRLFHDPASLDARCRSALAEDAKTNEDGPTKLYVSHHLSGLPSLASRFGYDGDGPVPATTVAAFLAALALRSIWATPDAKKILSPRRLQHRPG